MNPRFHLLSWGTRIALGMFGGGQSLGSRKATIVENRGHGWKILKAGAEAV
jgi:hypothetical protein